MTRDHHAPAHASRRAAPWILLIVVLLGAGACAAPPAPALESRPTIRVMSFNIRYGTASDGADAWRHRRGLVFDVLHRNDPDLVGLQEALRFQLDEILEAAPGYARVGVGRRDGRDAGEHAAILYRADRFARRDEGTFWFSDTPDVPGSIGWGNRVTRICTWARLRDTVTGAEFTIFNVHLDHESQPSRERSVELLLEHVAAAAESGPVIITGDFNAGERNPAMLRVFAIRDSESPVPPLVDTFRVVRPEATDVGTFGGFRGRVDGEKIDYVIVTWGVTVHEASIVRDHDGERYPSDHYPVTATIELPR